MSHICVNPTGGASPVISPILSNEAAIVIVGGGCVGLATAMQLLKQGRRSEEVHIVMSSSTPSTTSNQAGALWRPFGEVSDANRAVFKQWGKETFQFLNQIRFEYGSELTGICLVSGYELFSQVQEKPFWSDDVIGFQMLDRRGLAEVGLDAEFGFFYTSIIVEMDAYMSWCHKELRKLGCKIHLRTLECLSDVHSMFPNVRLIINASGLGAAKLVKDDEIFPVAGHIVKVKCPSVHHFYMDSENTSYIFPRLHDVVVGGTYFKGQWDVKPNIGTRNEIIEKASKMVPDLNRAPIVGEYIGLRPYREVTRLELEYPPSHPKAQSQKLMAKQPISDKVRVPVIHNYGHGGSGITLHWGCATTVLELSQGLISSPSKSTTSKMISKL